MNTYHRKLRFLFATIILFVALAGTSHAGAITGTELQITNDPGHQRFPAIYGDKIVWSDDSGSGVDIYLYNISTGERRRLTTSGYHKNYLHMRGDIITWNDPFGGLHLYDFKKGEEKSFVSSTLQRAEWPANIYDNKIVFAATGLEGGESDIFMYDTTTDTTTRITSDPAPERAPAIYGNKIVFLNAAPWWGADWQKAGVYVYDIETQQLTKIHSGPVHSAFRPDIYEHTIVWAEPSSMTQDRLHVYNLETKGDTILDAQSRVSDGLLHIFRDKIVWLGTDLAEILSGKLPKNAIDLYDITTGERSRLTGLASNFDPIDIHEGGIVWSDTRSGVTHDIYLYQFASPNNPPTLSYSQDPGYASDTESPGVDPNKGTANSTPFTFKVIYTDADNDPPIETKLILEKFENDVFISYREYDLFADNPQDSVYTDRKKYFVSIFLPQGKFRYYFRAGQAGGPVVLFPPAGDVRLVEVSGIPVQQAEIFHNNAPSSILTAPTIQDPVNSVFGNYLYQTQDAAIPGLMPLVFARTYSSQSAENAVVGAKWTHNHHIYLKVYDDGVIVVNGDGRWDLFMKDEAGNYAPQAGVFDTLMQDEGGGYTLTKKDQSRYVFTAQGNIRAMIDRNDNALSYVYDARGCLDAVTEPTGRILDFVVDEGCVIVRVADPAGQGYSYEYDAAGNLVSATDPSGGVERYTYDDQHNLVSIIDRNGNTLVTNTYDESRVIGQRDAKGNNGTFVYDTDARITTYTNSSGHSTHYHYDALSRVFRTMDALGGATTKEFDGQNNITKITDARGNVTTFSYDERGNALGIVNPLGNTTAFAYDSRNNLMSFTDGRGNMTRFEYDVRGNLMRRIDPLGAETIIENNDSGQPRSITDARGNTIMFSYDAHGNRNSIIDPLGNSTAYAYDIASRISAFTDALGNVVSFEYDALGRPTRVIDPLGNTTVTKYDRMGNVVSVTDAAGNVTGYGYDEKNNLVKVVDAMGNITRYAYDARDNLVSVVDPNGATTMYAYDRLNRMRAVTDPLGKTEKYAYDTVGNVSIYTNGEGEAVTYQYDAVDRLVRKVFPAGASVFSYDASGNLTSAENEHVGYSYEYNAANRVTAASDSRFGALRYAYGALGNRTALQDTSGHTTRYEYDRLNRLTRITDVEGREYVMGYDAVSRRTGLDLPNRVITNYAYDEAGRLTELASKVLDGETLTSFVYAYDVLGNRTARSELERAVGYTYDPLSRLVEARELKVKEKGNGKEKILEAYGYDSFGNRLMGPKKQAYAYNRGNELLRVGEKMFTYDANGNVIAQERDDTMWKYVYDAENRLVKVVKTKEENDTEKVVTYLYDPFGRRIKKIIEKVEDGETEDEKVQEYLYDNEDIMAIYDGKGRGVFFVHGPGIDEPLSVTEKEETYYYLFDGLGSVVGLTDNEGEIVQQNEYDGFGNLKQEGNKVKQPYAFTGRELDKETWLYFYRARYYDPAVGRFISRDPFRGFLDIPVSLNQYTYALSNPVRYNDPDGYFVDIARFFISFFESADAANKSSNTNLEFSKSCYGGNIETCTPDIQLRRQEDTKAAIGKVAETIQLAPDVIYSPMLSGISSPVGLEIFDVLKNASWLYERTKEILTIPVAKAEAVVFGK